MNPDYYLPLHLDGSSDYGVLLIHGFSATPKSVEPWAMGLHQAGYSVQVPLLAGHGSDWRELKRSDWGDWLASAYLALEDLKKRCNKVYVAGFSMGGALALRLAENYPDLIAGLLLLNPTIFDNHIRMTLARYLAPLLPSVKSEGTDVAKPNAIITSQQRISVHAANSLHEFRHLVRKDLRLVNQPMKIFLSKQDHVVPISNGLLIANSVASRDVQITYFDESFHVVALDYEADQLIKESVDFLRSLESTYSLSV